ncbi:MAG: flagellar filament capping protein FliD [Bdellovibrionota bacterium]
MIDKIMEAQSVPLERAKRVRSQFINEKNEYASLGGLLEKFRSATDGLSLPSGFNKFIAESSHPDILDAAISGTVAKGNYDFEVRGLAQAEKHLAFGFPDINNTPVGFGFLSIEKDNGELIDVTIDPGSTLKDVAQKINDSSEEYKAQIINTGEIEDPFRLLVSSVETGAATAIHIDEDTTFLEFKNIKKGKDVDLLFEDVPITSNKNTLNDLLDGININLKKAEPGTKVSLTVREDIDSSLESIKQFTDGYNKILNFANGGQATPEGKVDQGENAPNQSRRFDSDTRTVVRRLQSAVSSPVSKSGRFQSLAQIGVTTNAKTGVLEVDENKVRQALTKNYNEVMELFSSTEAGEGVAKKLSNAVKGLTSYDGGIIKTHTSTLQHQITAQDQEIDRQTDRLEKTRARITKQFAALENTMSNLNGQSAFLTARFGNNQNTNLITGGN